MSKTICGADCAQCPSREECKGCAETRGCPFGRQCFLAKYMIDFGQEKLAALQQAIMEEVNGLHIPTMKPVEALYPMRGSFVNLPYRLPSGQTAHRWMMTKFIFAVRWKPRPAGTMAWPPDWTSCW